MTLKRKEPQRGQFWSIRTKLIISFSLLFMLVLLVIELVDINGIPFIEYTGRRGQQREEAFRSLNLVADLKKDRLLRWIEERRYDIYVFADNDLVETNVARLHAAIHELVAASKKDRLWPLVQQEQDSKSLTEYLDNIRTTYRTYNKIMIADVETGTVFVSTDETTLGDNVSQESFFTEALKTGNDYVSDIELEPHSRQPRLHIAHVIKNETGEIIAILIMEVNADKIIKPILHTGEGLGEQGEALLINQEVKILTSLKHPLADGNIATPLEYQITAKPAVFAARGEEGIIETEDYRGEQVLAAYRHIRVSSDWGWGLVVKRDQEELFAPLQQSVAYTVLIGAIGTLVLISLTFILADNLTRPILSLSETANKVAAGNLEIRAPVTTSDEVGSLATTFNAMVQRIQHWHEELEEQVKSRTVELNETNKALKVEIAERARAEETLQESEHFNRTIVSSVGEGIVVYDRELRYQVWNKFMENLTGLPAEKVLGKNALDIFPHLREQGVDRLLNQAMSGEVITSPDTPYQIPQTEMQGWVRGVYSPHITAGGETIGVVATIRDITKRKHAEEALEQRAAQLALLNDIGGQITTVLGLDSVLERAAQLVHENFGYHYVALFILDRKQNELVMKARAGDFADLFPLDHRIRLDKGVNGWVARHGEKLLANNVNIEPHYVNFFPDIIPTQSELSVPIRVGKEIVGVIDIQSSQLNAFEENDVMVIETLANQVAVAAENARLYEAVQQELAERVWAEESLRQERDRVQMYLDIVGVIIIAIDANQQISLINKKGCEILGYTEEEIIGKNWFDHFLPKKIKEEVKAVFAKLIAGEIESDEYFENPVLTKTGQERMIAWHNAIIKDKTGKIIGALSSGEDITKRKQAEEERERLNRELMEKNKELEQVVYVTSHDLRSPLVNIQGFSKELEQAFKYVHSVLHSENIPAVTKDKLAFTIEEDVPEALQFIFAGTAKMDSLLSGLLRLSRLGRAALIAQQLDMNNMIADVVRAFEFQIKETGATLEVDNLPPCFGDKTQINQVFSNLVDNALKYLDPNRPGIIRISGRKEEENVVYCVEDNGIGIAAKHQGKIYQIFHRLDPVASSGEGLGLTIIQRILVRHNGKIWVESEPDKGSKFFITLANNQ